MTSDWIDDIMTLISREHAITAINFNILYAVFCDISLGNGISRHRNPKSQSKSFSNDIVRCITYNFLSVLIGQVYTYVTHVDRNITLPL